MKTKFTLLAVLLAAFTIGNAQTAPVPNGGFEQWDSITKPTGWTTYESIIGQLSGSGLAGKDSVDKHAGTASVKLSNVFVPFAGPNGDTIGGVVSVGTGFFDGQQPHLYGVPFTSKPDTIGFWYKYAPVGNDTCGFFIALSRSDSAGVILAGGFALSATGANWGEIYLPIKQFYNDTVHGADTLLLQFSSSFKEAGKPIVGSTMHVDAVRFGYKTAPLFVENINNNLNVRVFPNPTTDFVTIQTSEPVNNASIIVYDMTGRVITHEFGGSQNFELVTKNWESGLYSYSILSGGVVVNKGRIAVQR
jgi:hypothetical protein